MVRTTQLELAHELTVRHIPAAGPAESLWEEMVLFQRNRIEQDYIPGLRASFKAYDAVRTQNNTKAPLCTTTFDATLSVLRDLLFDHNFDRLDNAERYARLAVKCHHLRQITDVQKVLYSSSGATPKSKSLWLSICSFARLRIAFRSFEDAAVTLPSFKQVSMILVPRPIVPTDLSRCLFSLDQTFGVLKLKLNPATTKAVLGQNWTVEKVKREFAKRQKQRLNVHAEVQMLMYLNTEESAASRPFLYFGCSKLCCFMCNHFLNAYGRFATRGCHGRLFRPWTVPAMSNLLPSRADRITKALVSVQKEVRKKLKVSVDVHLRLERTSVVGKESVSTTDQDQRSNRQLQIDRLRMKAERDRVGELFRR
jgi:hypothetical protein